MARVESRAAREPPLLLEHVHGERLAQRLVEAEGERAGPVPASWRASGRVSPYEPPVHPGIFPVGLRRRRAGARRPRRVRPARRVPAGQDEVGLDGLLARRAAPRPPGVRGSPAVGQALGDQHRSAWTGAAPAAATSASRPAAGRPRHAGLARRRSRSRAGAVPPRLGIGIRGLPVGGARHPQLVHPGPVERRAAGRRGRSSPRAPSPARAARRAGTGRSGPGSWRSRTRGSAGRRC